MSEMLYVDYLLEKDQKEYLDNLLGKCGTIKENGKVQYHLEEKQKEAIDALLNKEGVIVENEKQWPFDGNKYYYIDDEGYILSSTWCVTHNIPLDVDIERRSIGNVFRTKEEAEFACKKLKVLNQLKSLSDDDQEWNYANNHYYIVYYMNDDKFEVWSNSNVTLPYEYWFKSVESAEAAIKTIGEDKLKKYVFDVKDK